jgi:hypothetical protein
MVSTLLLVLLLIVMVCMAVRDGRPFFGDPLKLAALIIAILAALSTWLVRGGVVVR